MSDNTEDKIKAFLKRLSWQKWALLIFIVMIFIVQISVFSQFKHIPGPIYGGDLYREKGFTLHILNGNPFWEDPYVEGEYEFYPPLGYLIAAGSSKLLAANPEKVLIFFPLFTTIFISIAAFLLGKVIFKD